MTRAKITRPRLLALLRASGWPAEWRGTCAIFYDPDSGGRLFIADSGFKLHITAFGMPQHARDGGVSYEQARDMLESRGAVSPVDPAPTSIDWAVDMSRRPGPWDEDMSFEERIRRLMQEL